ncbi:MAG: molybdenum cofactor guanylyltransferase [Flavobacteriales bacterium]|nr:molybdenum cofactor guanylyltransferase [Flavobacteriales bacterium]
MDLTGIILAGGKSSRMGEDKGLMSFEGKPMIQHIIDVVKPLVNNLIIIANDQEYEQFGYTVYRDLIKNKGPLAGIYTGLTHSNTEKNLVLSCDVPFVNEAILKLLIDSCEGVDVVIPKKDNRTHQLIGVYDKSCTEIFKSELEDDQLKLKLAIEKLNYKAINANLIDDKIFNNINSRNDIEA